MKALILGNALGAALWLALVTILATACSRTPAPTSPKTQTVIRDQLHCFLVSSAGGNGLVCTERSAPCRTIQGHTVLAQGVTGISECKRVTVQVDVPKE